MKPCQRRQLLSIILVLSFSCATLGTDGPSPPAAVLHPSGKVYVNGVGNREITTLFLGDEVQTSAQSAANITGKGSSVLVFPSSSVQFLGNVVELIQGSVAIATSEEMSAKAYGLTFTPVAKEISKFEVAEDEGSLVVAARQGNVTVTDGEETSTVQEGHEATYKKKKKGAPASNASRPRAISGKTLAILGATGATGVTTIILIETTGGAKRCISPTGNKSCH